MHQCLIIYSTTDGHTKKICERVARIIQNSSKTKLLCLTKAFTEDLSHYDSIIIGASIRYGKHKKELYKFIKKNIHTLNIKNNAFFSVNAVARKAKKNTPSTNPYIQKFLKLSNWSPKHLCVFAGQIDYPSYSFFDKYIICLIMMLTNGPTNLSNTYDFTNWQYVDEFSNLIIGTRARS